MDECQESHSLFPGQPQPSVPLAKHYSDLSDQAVREWQAETAQRFGVEGFCFYPYWFKGKLLLEKPCEAILASGNPDFPFCFSWANESWTRSWDGTARSVLIQQDYGTEADWISHFYYILTFFKDHRYITLRLCDTRWACLGLFPAAQEDLLRQDPSSARDVVGWPGKPAPSQRLAQAPPSCARHLSTPPSGLAVGAMALL